jgi:CubicO group peptidase (beta-lactamase class C family)
MKRLLVVSVAVAALMLAAFPSAAPRSLPDAGVNALNTFLSGQVSRGGIPGVVAVVVNREGVLYSGAFGKQNTAKSVPLSTTSIFRIASMTKAVTSVATMMMVEQGKLKLDDDVSTYLPAFKSMQILTSYDEKADTYETNKGGETDLPLVHAPGEKWTYGASTKVLGDIVEKLSGERIDAFTDRHIAKPLGMKDTFYEVPKSEYARVVTTNQKDAAGKITETQNPETIPVSLRGDGGLLSTAPDYGRFLQMLLNGGQLGSARILKASTVADMLKPHTNGVRVRPQPSATPGLSKPYPLGAGEDIWGLGFQLADPKKPDPNMRRPGSGNWAGIFNTFFWIDPKEELGVVVMMQMLPFYDQAAIETLQGVEQRVYSNLR